MSKTESEIRSEKIREIRKQIIGMALIKCLKQNPDEDIHIKYSPQEQPK